MYHSNKQEPFNIENVKKIAKEVGITTIPTSVENGVQSLYEVVRKETMSFETLSRKLEKGFAQK